MACEGGFYFGSRGNGKAIDLSGKTIKTFKGADMNKLHKQNFLAAVRSRDNASLNAEIAIGHDSTGWCNLANIAFQAGVAAPSQEANALTIDPNLKAWGTLLEEMEQQLKPFGLSSADLTLGPVLHHDPATESFTGENASQANKLLKRDYREGYAVPDYA